MATAVMPYTIGQSNISFVEEFNITFDSGVCVGTGVISGTRARTVLDAATVRGIAQILSNQEYSSAGFLGTVIGNAVLSSVDSGKLSVDSGNAVGVSIISFVGFGYVGVCQGTAIVSSGSGVSDIDSVALYAAPNGFGVLGLTRNIKTTNVLGQEVTEDRSTAAGSSEMTSTETLGHALFSDILVASAAQGDFYRTIGLSESIYAQTRFSGAESSVVIYRLLLDEGVAVGVSAAVAAPQDPLSDGTAGLHPYPPIDDQETYTFSVTLDDYWLNGTGEIDNIPITFTPRTYVTIPKANRIAVGNAQIYNSNYEVVGVGEPNLNNTPIIKFTSKVSDFGPTGPTDTIGGSEIYEPSFLRVEMFAGASVTHVPSTISVPIGMSFVIDESSICIGNTFVSGIEEASGGGYSRYGGQGIPPGIYGPTGATGPTGPVGHGVYGTPRGAARDDFITENVTEVSTTGITTTFTTLAEHRLTAGDTIAVSGVGAGYDGGTGWVIDSTPTTTTFTVLNIPGATGTLTGLIGIARSKNYYKRVLGGYVIGDAMVTGPTGPAGGTLSV